MLKGTKELVDFAVVSGVAFKAAEADGKIDQNDLMQVVPIFASLSTLLPDLKLIPSEISHLSEVDAEELLSYAAAKVPQITDKPKIVAIVNASLALGLALVKLVEAIELPANAAAVPV